MIPCILFLSKSGILYAGMFIVMILHELICYNPVNGHKAGESDVHDAGNETLCLAGKNRQSQEIVARRKKGKTAFLQRPFDILWSCPECYVIPWKSLSKKRRNSGGFTDRSKA